MLFGVHLGRINSFTCIKFIRLSAIVLTILALLKNNATGQTISNAFFKNPELMKKTILFALPEKLEGEISNEEIEQTIRKYWTINTNYEILPITKVIEACKAEKDKYIAAVFKTNKLYQLFDYSPKTFDGLYPNTLSLQFFCGRSNCYVSYTYLQGII